MNPEVKAKGIIVHATLTTYRFHKINIVHMFDNKKRKENNEYIICLLTNFLLYCFFPKDSMAFLTYVYCM